MPLIHVNVDEGALGEAQKQELIDRLTKAVLGVEGAPETPEALSISWLFLNEVKAGAWAIGGTARGASEQVKYLVYVTVPHGSLDDGRKKLMAERVNQVLVDVGGASPDPRSQWCIINEVPEGNWGAAGRIFGLLDVAQFVGLDSNSTRYQEIVAARA